MAATVVNSDGVLYEGAFGDATPQTTYRNASLTKAPTTTAALQLVEASRLDLDATVESILPEFGELQLLARMNGDEPVLRPPASKPTVRQLMTHTSGLGYFFGRRKLHDYCAATGTPWSLSGRRAALAAPLVNDPGTVWEYGTSVDWLGLVVEEISGRCLDAYLTEYVWGPLGMTSSTFHPSDADRDRLLPIRLRDADGALVPIDFDLPVDPDLDEGGSGSYGTIADYGRFLRAWLRGGELDGERVLGEETVALALTDQIEGVRQPQGAPSAVPWLSNDVPSFPFAQGWGLGFHLTKEDVPGLRRAGTADWAGLFNCYAPLASVRC